MSPTPDDTTKVVNFGVENNNDHHHHIPAALRRFSLKVFEEEEAQEVEFIKDVKEQIVHAVGTCGKWQLQKCIYIVFIIWMPASFHLLNMVFYRAKSDHWCARPTEYSGWPTNEWRNLTSVTLLDGDFDHCNQFNLNWSNLYRDHGGDLSQMRDSMEYQQAVDALNLRPCEDWEYDRSFWKRTIIQEWNLVCGDSSRKKLTQQATFFGLLCGVFASGLLSDRFGRLKTMLCLLTMIIVCGTATSFSPTYEAYLVGIWACGFSAIGFGTVMYCWMMEMLGGREKTIFGCAPHLNFAFWGFAVAVIAYLIPNWHQMQLLFSLPLIALYVTYWVLPESPRWLLAQGRTEEAEKILREIADFNGKPLHDDFRLHPPPVSEHHGSGKGFLGFLELFKTPFLRMKTLIVYYLWFATSLIYYGLTLNSNDFGASLFAYFSIGKAMEFPTIILVTILLLNTGRRMTLLILYSVCGLSLLLTMAIPTGYFVHEWPIVALNIAGRGCSIGTLAVCYVYSAEIFPTVIRNVGIGSSSVWARIGPMIAPYIADLAGIEPRLPIVVFGVVALIAAFLVTFLPETAHHKLPDTIAEGEDLGKGDTLWSSMGKSCCGVKKSQQYNIN